MSADFSELGSLWRRARCVFLDCDGVIFDSNGFKLEAMRQTLAGHSPAEVSAMEAFWRSNGGASRFLKFEHFYTHIAPRADVRQAMEAASQRFSQLSLAAYERVQPLAAALELARAAGRERVHVVSGAAQTELESVFAAKNITSLFGSILGSPRPKRELVAGVLEERRCPPDEAFLIGDGAIDHRVCHELGLHFVYLAEHSEWSSADQALTGAPRVTVAQTWSELRDALLS